MYPFSFGTAADIADRTISSRERSSSIPMLFLQEAMAARVVVPVPRKGSITRSPLTEYMFMSR